MAGAYKFFFSFTYNMKQACDGTIRIQRFTGRAVAAARPMAERAPGG